MTPYCIMYNTVVMTKSQEKIRATLLFVFNQDLSKVLLLKKKRPAFHEGKINGLGGKNDPHESDYDCASRELFEESGLTIKPDTWQYYAHLHWTHWIVPVLAARYEGKESDARSLEEGEVDWYDVDCLPETCIPNLTWLIPMGKDVLSGANFDTVTIEYKEKQ